MHAATGVPPHRERDGVLVRVASGDPDPQMPKTAEIAEPRLINDGVARVRKPRVDLVLMLEQLAYNLRWSWNPGTRDLFQSLAPEPWRKTHNPIAALRSAASDPDR